jgi:Zn-dependent protease with chaperone function
MKIPLGVEPKFGRLVRHLERWAAAHVLSYRLIVMLLALVGYAYLMGALLLLVAAAGAIVFRLPGLLIFPVFGLSVFAPFFVLGSIIISALWVRIEAPGGYEVTHETAPALFALLDKVRRAARAPRVHRVLITEEFNAGIASLPRLGVFGWSRNYLTLGMLLMQSVSEDEFTAVVAHEFGHLAGRHGWFLGWIYRLRMTWWRIAYALQRRARWSRWFFTPFYSLYVPYFNAYSFVLARANEYEADRMSAEIAGPNAAATALVRVDTVGHYLSSRFWPTLYKAANNHAEPPYLPLARLREELGKPLGGTYGAAGTTARWRA